ncbi:hypothetical protein [Luteimonas mephitis]|uniref:hypothetical protein n=1 Tax=Luteimonas mephitis TaxID=83615 RepID=UPI003A937599
MPVAHADAAPAQRPRALRPPAMLVALLAAALGGALVGSRFAGHRASAGVDAAASPEAAVPLAAPPLRSTRALRAATAAPVGDDLGSESTRALRDPAYLRELMARHAGETDPGRRGALLAVLQSAANDEVMGFALRLADDPDPQSRRDGLQLLQAFPLDRAPVRELLLRQIDAERDPQMLRQLVDALTPAVLPVEDAAPIAERLARLRSHADPGVRASSVLQSTQWDRQADMEPVLYAAMLDPEPQVQQAAIAGVNATLAHSPRLKAALLEMAGNDAIERDQRAAAVFALQAFPLDRDEYELYRRVAVETGPAASEAAPGPGHGP